MNNEYFNPQEQINPKKWINEIRSENQTKRSWRDFDVPSDPVFYFAQKAVSEQASKRNLGSDDGFPWCSISERLFSEIGLTIQDVNRQEIDRILGKGFIYLYPELDSMAISRFNPLFQMGLYIDENPIGFSYSGILPSWTMKNSEEAGDEIAEIGLIHISPNMNSRGFGTVLFNLTCLRLLTLNPDEFMVKIIDKTGKAKHIVEKVGFNYYGVSYLHHYPLFLKVTSSEKMRKLFQKSLMKSLKQKLQLMTAFK